MSFDFANQGIVHHADELIYLTNPKTLSDQFFNNIFMKNWSDSVKKPISTLFLKVNEPVDVNAVLLDIQATLNETDNILTQLMASNDVASLVMVISMYGSVVNVATEQAIQAMNKTESAAGNMTVEMSDEEKQKIIQDGALRCDVSADL